MQTIGLANHRFRNTRIVGFSELALKISLGCIVSEVPCPPQFWIGADVGKGRTALAEVDCENWSRRGKPEAVSNLTVVSSQTDLSH